MSANPVRDTSIDMMDVDPETCMPKDYENAPEKLEKFKTDQAELKS